MVSPFAATLMFMPAYQLPMETFGTNNVFVDASSYGVNLIARIPTGSLKLVCTFLK